MTCTSFHLRAKILEYRIEIGAYGVIKGYKMRYKVKCKCLIIHRKSERWQLSTKGKSLKLN